STFRRPGAWSASFALPAWLAPWLAHGAVLWVDNAAVLMPPPEGELPAVEPPPPETLAALDPPEPGLAHRPEAEPVLDAAQTPGPSRPPEPPRRPPPRGPRRLGPIELADRIRHEVEHGPRPDPNGAGSPHSNGQPGDAIAALR